MSEEERREELATPDDEGGGQPDGCAEPTPYEEEPAGDGREEDKGFGPLHIVAAAAVAGTFLLIVPALYVQTHTSGATRSGRLEWEQRQVTIQEAVAEQAAEEAAEHDGAALEESRDGW